MKKLSDGTVFEAVNGLWLSGLYGIRAGAGLGLIAGAIVGTVIPLAGNLVGAVIGCLVGAIVGLPAGILGYAIGERKGWRIAGCASCLLVGSAIARLWYVSMMAPYQRMSCEINRADQVTFFIISFLALSLFSLVGLWLGDVIYNRLEACKSDFYSRWVGLMEKHPIIGLPARSRAICLGIALIPVLLTYAQLTAFLCRPY